jgi:hypothetical protein
MANTSSESVMLSTEQQTVFDWLNDELDLRVYAEAYKGALELLDKKSPGYITFVSHTGRELMNGLPRLGVDREQVQYVSRLEEIQENWKDEWGEKRDNKMEDAENGHLIPYEIREKIQDLIVAHRAGRLRASEADSLFFSTFLHYADIERIPQSLLTEWQDARKSFVSYSHLRDEEFEMDAPSKVESHFRMLDNLLYAVASGDFERIRIVYESLETTNE